VRAAIEHHEQIVTAPADYAIRVHASASAQRVFAVLTTADEFGSWWAPAAQGGELQISFDGIEDPLVLRVRQATPAAVNWDVQACVFLPEWVGTLLAFTLSEPDAGGCDVHFRHQGLCPRLSCYEICRDGWGQYLSSLRDYIQTGSGNPFTPARLG
jgi:uncharacterized protein YndB with AHSA1/START domain